MSHQGLQAVAAFAIALWLACAFGIRLARADGGEAGLVIQNGDVVTTYCVAFTGDGISGDQLVLKAGVSVGTGGGQSGRTVCSIDQTGCFNVNPNDFNSCFCQCTGGPTCTYWAYFTRPYGKSWAYSSLAFNLVKSKDGDIQGWKWGAGGPSSAPAPKDVTFEQICGHAPQGGVAPTVALAPTSAPATSHPGAAAPPAGSTSVPASSTATATGTAGTAGPTGTPPPIPNGTLVAPEPGVTPGVPGVGAADDSGDSGRQWLAFGVVAGGLLVAIAMALTWRRRRGL